ncbi:hypothetical protein IV203_026105 [Nitzschia inconspicua]|uniref:Uncharacterized protein n=1 Tax=Nitzschia inconspicua TaxID=303405 RepID=A0A9K3LJC0_9STRA|nr:hypothetical protein IV203_026105 [Nitzschia inconspicua]
MPGFLIPSLEQYRNLRLYKRRRRVLEALVSKQTDNPLLESLDATTQARLETLPAVHDEPRTVASRHDYKQTNSLGPHRKGRRSKIHKSEKPQDQNFVRIFFSESGNMNGDDASIRTCVAIESQVSYRDTNPDTLIRVELESSKTGQICNLTRSMPDGAKELLTQFSTASSVREVAEVDDAMIAALMGTGTSERSPEKTEKKHLVQSRTPNGNNYTTCSNSPPKSDGRLLPPIVSTQAAQSGVCVLPLQLPSRKRIIHQQQHQQQDVTLTRQELPLKQQSNESSSTISLTSNISKPWFQKRKRKKLSQTKLCFSNRQQQIGAAHHYNSALEQMS